MTTSVPLAGGFPRFTERDWHDALRRARRNPVGEDAAAAGASLSLFPRRSEARAVVSRMPGAPWGIIQRVDAASAEAAMAMLSNDLAGGATGAEIAFAGSLHPLGGKLPAVSARVVADALMANAPGNFALRVDATDPGALGAFVDAASATQIELVVTHDPVAAIALGADDRRAELGDLAAVFESRGVGGAVAIADGRLWHAAGATDEQELGVTLATWVEHLRSVGRADRVGVALTADSDQFRTIAKFRAMRLLLARVAEVAALGGLLLRIHAETAWRSMSTRGPETNILRATSAAFGAAIGGADSITVLPFDAASGAGDTHARRLARNTHLILADEAGLARVADAGAGSGAIEAMTAALAQAAWRRFQQIESEGGIVAAITSGGLIREIASARAARLAGVAAGETKMIGVNAYLEGAESASTAERRAPDRGATLAFVRLAEPFE